MLLEHIKGITPDAELEKEYSDLAEQVNLILDQLSMIVETPMNVMSDQMAGQEGDVGNMPPAPGQVSDDAGSDGGYDKIMTALETVLKQMDAAKRGLGLVNKLSDSPSRSMNRSRVMSNMNKIRANIGRIEKMMGKVIQSNFQGAEDDMRSKMGRSQPEPGVRETIDMNRLAVARKAQSKRGMKDPFHQKKRSVTGKKPKHSKIKK